MPIANCFIKDEHITQSEVQELAEQWAGEIPVDINEICLTVFTDFMQAGQQYKAMINLYLPSLWPEEDIKKIQRSLAKLLSKKLKAKPNEIFILTSIIQSGHVMENGKVVEW